MSPRIRRTSLLLALIVLFAPQPAAHASTVSAAAFRWVGQRCSWGQTSISSDWGRPGLESVASMDASWGNWCDDPHWMAEIGQITVQQDLFAWRWTQDGGGFWFNCAPGPRFTNRWKTHEWWTWFRWDNRPCSSHFFFGRGRAAIHFNGRWLGDDVAVDTPDVLVP